MFDIMKISPIINHLKKISNYYNDHGKEIIMYCVYCDDATRPNPKHGHLYIDKTQPIFHCFRCDTSGTLLRLLIDSGFDDSEILQYLSQFIKYRTIKDYYKTKKKSAKINQIQESILNKNIEFEKQYPSKYEIYNKYLKTRLGNVDFSKFLISPTYFYEKLSCLFTNCDNEEVALRLIEPYKDIRYHLFQETSGRYYFQEKDFDKYRRVVLAEGPFDMLPLYLYSDEFKNCFFIALNGKKYNSAIEWLILEHFLIGFGQFDFIFDNDNSKYNRFLFTARLLTKQYNENIIIKGWKPMIGNDTGDFPGIIQI